MCNNNLVLFLRFFNDIFFLIFVCKCDSRIILFISLGRIFVGILIICIVSGIIMLLFLMFFIWLMMLLMCLLYIFSSIVLGLFVCIILSVFKAERSFICVVGNRIIFIFVVWFVFGCFRMIVGIVFGLWLILIWFVLLCCVCVYFEMCVRWCLMWCCFFCVFDSFKYFCLGDVFSVDVLRYVWWIVFMSNV